MQENKFIKEIYELIKDQPQEKVNAVILYHLISNQALLEKNYKAQMMIDLSGALADKAQIYASAEKETISTMQIHNILNLLENLD